MRQRTVKRVLAGVALMAALTLTSPAPAQAAGLGGEGLWGWLTSLFDGRIVSLRTGSGMKPVQRSRHSGSSREVEKSLGCIDPNGCASSQTTGTSICTAHSDIGVCIDPNG
jgi:hypothetical protein